jgi:hypothetical protein
MADPVGLLELRSRRFFDGWWEEEYGLPRASAAQAAMARLVSDLIALGAALDEAAARRAVDECVRRFNDINDGWICTFERDAIHDMVYEVIKRCGFEPREDWLWERDW